MRRDRLDRLRARFDFFTCRATVSRRERVNIDLNELSEHCAVVIMNFIPSFVKPLLTIDIEVLNNLVRPRSKSLRRSGDVTFWIRGRCDGPE
jgi:hypothetical protein